MTHPSINTTAPESGALNYTISTPSYSLRYLDETHLPQMLQLQQAILYHLDAEGHSNYIVPKNEAHFSKYAGAMQGKAIGVFMNETLVAQTMLDCVTPYHTEKALTLCDGSQPIISSNTNYAVISGVLVHPEHRKRGLMKEMIVFGVEQLQQEGQFLDIYAEVADGNTASQRGFESNGFSIAASGVDPDDQCPLIFMHYKI